jgi:hypothetical protein
VSQLVTHEARVPAPSAEDDPLAVLGQVRAARELVDDQQRRWVLMAREKGHTWAQIAGALGVTQQAVSKRYRHR